MPVTWYFAPPGAKRLDVVNSFTSGIWDRDSVALSPLLGEQRPYQFPFSNGKNPLKYRGLCRIGTDEQWANGLTQAEATGTPTLTTIPECCRPPLPVTACINYPEGLPQRFNMRIFPKPGTVIPPGWEPLFEQQTATWQSQCLWFTSPIALPSPVGTRSWTLSFSPTTWGLFVFSGAFFSFTWTSAGRYPAFISAGFSGVVTIPTLFIRESVLVIVPYPEDVPVQPIQLAGDVIGSGDLTPIGATIPTALVSIVSPGSAGDSTHIPVFTIDHKGRVTALTQVAVAGSAVAIGAPVGSGIPNSVLFVDGSGNLGNDAAFQFDGINVGITGPGLQVTVTTPHNVVFTDGTRFAEFVDGTQAAFFADGVRIVTICDGVNHVLYTWGGGLTAWSGIPPTDVWTALDRLANWMAVNFGGLPLP